MEGNTEISDVANLNLESAGRLLSERAGTSIRLAIKTALFFATLSAINAHAYDTYDIYGDVDWGAIDGYWSYAETCDSYTGCNGEYVWVADPFTQDPPVGPDPSGDASNDGSGGSAGGSGPDNQAICSVLAGQGRPKDCDRALAAQGQFTFWNNPYTFPDIPELGNMSSGSYFTQPIKWAADYELANCYRDPSKSPDECEAEYKQTFIDAYNGSWHSDSDVAFFQQAMDDLDRRFGSAREERWEADFIKADWGASFLGLEIKVEIPLYAWLLGPYNTVYDRARRAEACLAWYNAWDGSSCSNSYGSR
jgi:hypothetical protein